MSSKNLIPRVFGSEIEYGVSAPGVAAHKDIAGKFANYIDPAVKNVNSFLSNGARAYLDMATHPEYATPECTTLDELVNSEFAGEHIIADSLVRMSDYSRLHPGYRLHKRVVDSKGELQGAHENYSITRRLGNVIEETRILGPYAAHLLTRQIFTGAGLRTGQGWQLSQKMHRGIKTFSNTNAHLDETRPLIDLRDQPLATEGEFFRLHVSSGDANMSPWALRMKFGATSLFLRLLEHGFDLEHLALKPGTEVGMASKISGDISGKQLITLANGKQVSAVDIQEDLATRATELLPKRMPMSAEDSQLMAEWIEACDDMRRDPLSLADRTDWAAKIAVAELIAERKGRALSIAQDQAIDQLYDKLNGSDGIALQLRRKGHFRNMPSTADIQRAVTEPPKTTRAFLRGAAVTYIARSTDKNLSGVNWDYVKIDGSPYYLNRPAGTRHTKLQARIDF